MSEKKIDFKELLSKLKKKYNDNKTVISAFAYLMLVFVVIYGLTIGVYDGFPLLVPYIIILLFLLMAFRRLYQCFMKDTSKSGENKSETKEK